MFDQAKKLWDLKRQADELKKELAAEVLEVDRGDIHVTIAADMQLKNLDYPKDTSTKDLIEALNKAIEEAQKVAGKRLQGQMQALQDLLK